MRSAIVTAVLALGACAAAEESLEAVHADIAADYANVAQISSESLANFDPETLLILDIREPEEYAVSRIPGAIWVNPASSAEAATIQIGSVEGKHIIVYCSVGMRSSIFAEREQETLLANGAISVANLERGIFGWHNDERDLVDANGTTDVVHPYDAVWKRYVEREDKASYTPAKKAP